MKREIKFRAWHIKNEIMLFVSNLSWTESGNPDDTVLEIVQGINAYDSDKYELMQYTGLRDKNGKEIYEGDIVAWDDCSDGKYWRIAEVLINPDIQFSIIHLNESELNKLGYKNSKLQAGELFKYGAFIYTDTHNHLIVIGNIYENPELFRT